MPLTPYNKGMTSTQKSFRELLVAEYGEDYVKKAEGALLKIAARRPVRNSRKAK